MEEDNVLAQLTEQANAVNEALNAWIKSLISAAEEVILLNETLQQEKLILSSIVSATAIKNGGSLVLTMEDIEQSDGAMLSVAQDEHVIIISSAYPANDELVM